MPVTSLDKKLWVFGYKMKSKSALKLAEFLDVWMIKHEESSWKGKGGQFVLNWGAGTGVFNAKVGNATILNTPQQVDTCINKLDFFRAVRGRDAPRVPFWTQNRGTAEGWLSSGLGVIARTKLEGSKGAGLVAISDPSEDLPEAPLYTCKVPSLTEYRVYMFNGEVLDAREKRLSQGALPDPEGMRCNEESYKYCRLDGEPLPEDVKVQSIKCIRKIGLFTGGVDVLWDGAKATVLEVNSAPYLGDVTAEKYAEKIKEYIQGVT